MGGALAGALGGTGASAAAGSTAASAGAAAGSSFLVDSLKTAATNYLTDTPIGAGLAAKASGATFAESLGQVIKHSPKDDDEEMKKRKKEMLADGQTHTRDVISSNPYNQLVESNDWQQYTNT